MARGIDRSMECRPTHCGGTSRLPYPDQGTGKSLVGDLANGNVSEELQGIGELRSHSLHGGSRR